MDKKLFLMSGLIICLGACAPEQSTTLSQPLSTGASAGTPSAPVLDKKPATPLPITEQLEPDAAELAAHPTMRLPASMPASQQERLAASPMPVLLPETMSQGHLEKAIVTTGEHWFAVSSTHDGVTLYIHGMRTTTEYPQLELDKAGEELAMRPFSLSRTHQIVTLGFERFGLGYSMDVECAKPMTDTRCTQDDYAIALFESMRLVKFEEQGGVR